MIFAFILIPLLLVTACARPDYSAYWPDQLIVSAGPQPGYAIKRVVDKLASSTLVGDDGSLCRTSTGRFASTRVGSWISCTWTLPTIDDDEITAEA